MTTTREVRETPNLGLLYPKAALTAISKRGGELPDIEYVHPDVTVDVGHLAAYNRVCEFRLRDDLPATYPHILAFPLQLKLMTEPSFPFPLPGMVHLNNKIIQHRPIGIGEQFSLRVRVNDLRPHERGSQFDMISEATVGDEVVWTDISTYLHRGKSTQSPSAKQEPLDIVRPDAVWQVPADIGRRYAAVSGDSNPIHTHRITAKLFGFKRAIAHGMWTKARCLAAFEGGLPDTFTVDVRFKLPVFLPAKAGFIESSNGTDRTFLLFDARKGRPHLEGVIQH